MQNALYSQNKDIYKLSLTKPSDLLAFNIHSSNRGSYRGIIVMRDNLILLFLKKFILVPRGRAPFGQHQESRPPTPEVRDSRTSGVGPGQFDSNLETFK